MVTLILFSEAPRASARGICGEAKRNSAEANPAFHPPQLGLLRTPSAIAYGVGRGRAPYGVHRGRLSPSLSSSSLWRRLILPVLPHRASWRRRVRAMIGEISQLVKDFSKISVMIW